MSLLHEIGILYNTSLLFSIQFNGFGYKTEINQVKDALAGGILIRYHQWLSEIPQILISKNYVVVFKLENFGYMDSVKTIIDKNKITPEQANKTFLGYVILKNDIKHIQKYCIKKIFPILKLILMKFRLKFHSVDFSHICLSDFEEFKPTVENIINLC